MIAADIAQYMRELVDDPGVVRLSYARQARMLALAYEEFRNMAPAEVFERPYNATGLVNTAAIDLTGILFYTNAGVAPSEGVLASRLTRVVFVDPVTGAILATCIPKASWEQLGQIPTTTSTLSGVYLYRGLNCWLDGNILRFSYPISGSVQIWYQPTETINWLSAIAPGASTFVDNLTQFHDVIAILGAEQYYVSQAQLNPALEALKQRRLDKMVEFFAQSRTGKASRYVGDEYTR